MHMTQMTSHRSARVRAAPARFHGEQEALHALSLAALAEAAPWPLQDEESSSSESNTASTDDEEKEGEGNAQVAEHNTWTDQYTPIIPHGHRRRAVPLAELGDDSSENAFFALFVPDAYIDSIVQHTNAYAEQRYAQRGGAPAEAAAAATHWQATSAAEVKALLGCLIYMSIVRLTHPHDYWAAETRQTFVADTFPRDRFLELLRVLRLNSSSPMSAQPREPLQPLQPLIALLLTAARQYFYPGRHVSVDEAMCGFQGRSHMVQHIARKAEDTGFKVWMLVDVDSGFVVTFDIYTGAKEAGREERASENVVLKLTQAALTQPHHVVVMDNYFTSVHLFLKLLERKQYAVGTMQSRRKQFPRELLKKDMARGESLWRQHRQEPRLTVVSWADKSPVHFLSTCTNPTAHEQVQRHTSAGLVTFNCPPVVNVYARYMRGVDVFSQRRSYAKLGRKSRKYFYSLAWFLLDIAISNAYILWTNKHAQQKGDQKKYRKALMQQLVGGFSACRQRGRTGGTDKRVRDSLHTVEHNERRGACQICRHDVGRGGHNSRSHWRCVDCSIFVCMPNCYNTHVKQLAQHTDT